MNQWPFILAAYAVAVGGTGLLTIWSLVAMRRAEGAEPPAAADAAAGRAQ
jgi:hypothetical protein